MINKLTLFDGDLLMSIMLKIQTMTTFHIFENADGSQAAVNTCNKTTCSVRCRR